MSKMSGAEVAKPNRDRFVGFAFAGGHLLLETNNAGVITFAAGARCGLVTGSLDDMINHSVFEYFPSEEHSLLRMLLLRLIKKGKLDVTHVVMKSAANQTFSAFLGACRLPNHPDRCFFSVSIRGQATNRTAGRGIPDVAAFMPVLESHLAAAKATEISQALSMVLIEGLQNARGEDKIREVLEAYFLSISTGGDSAVRLSEDHYAVLHGEEGALEDIQRNINQLLADSNADELMSSTRMWRVNIGKSELPLADVARAIGFTLKRFASESPKGFEIINIDQTIEELLSNTVERVSRVRATLEKRNFHLVFQPIVRLTTGQLHHVEAFMRIDNGDSPADFVAFAEGIGLNTDLDLMVVQETLDVLRNAYLKKQIIPDIAVNISGQSLSSKMFLDQLEKVIQPYSDVSKKLLIDVIDFSTLSDFSLLKASLVRLRKMGLRRCLGDVGGGNASFMSLNELSVDFAKLGEHVVHGAVREGRERTILQSIIQICSHLGILIIAEKIETEQQRNLLRSLGIPLGQGFLFGQPSTEMPPVDLHLKGTDKRR